MQFFAILCNAFFVHLPKVKKNIAKVMELCNALELGPVTAFKRYVAVPINCS